MIQAHRGAARLAIDGVEGEQQSPSAIHVLSKRREQGMMLTMVSAEPKKEATKNKPCVQRSKLITFCHP